MSASPRQDRIAQVLPIRKGPPFSTYLTAPCWRVAVIHKRTQGIFRMTPRLCVASWERAGEGTRGGCQVTGGEQPLEPVFT